MQELGIFFPSSNNNSFLHLFSFDCLVNFKNIKQLTLLSLQQLELQNIHPFLSSPILPSKETCKHPLTFKNIEAKRKKTPNILYCSWYHDRFITIFDSPAVCHLSERRDWICYKRKLICYGSFKRINQSIILLRIPLSNTRLIQDLKGI